MEKKTQGLLIDDAKYETEVPEGYLSKSKKIYSNPREIRAVMPGVVADIYVRKGEKVTSGDVLIVLEAMKMYNDIETEVDGKITEINVKKGDKVTKGQLMIKLA